MNPNFASALQLLQNLSGEVSGRQPSRPPAEVEQLVHNLLDGSLAPEQRAEMCRILRDRPEWVAWVAEQIKSRRSAAS